MLRPRSRARPFDSVEHKTIWEALARQGVDKDYIEVLKRLYANQLGKITVVSQTSRAFEIGRGTKQGDPLSTLLFNAVLEDIFREVRDKWQARKFGIEMSEGPERHLSSLCFADDVLLLAANITDLKEMMNDLMQAAAKRGLEAHDEKTSVLTNAADVRPRQIPEHVTIGVRRFKVLGPSGTIKWLGRKVSFQDPHECELSNRIAAAWGAFTKHKSELTSKKYCLKDRLRLFEAVVTSTMLYGCEAWTLNIRQQSRMRTVQRKMLRTILNARRRRIEETSSRHSHSEDSEQEEGDEDLLEPWTEFLRRTTRWTEEQLQKSGQCEWLETWRKRQWRWAAKLATRDVDKWSAISTRWQPLIHTRGPRGRAQARPRKRWDQDIVDYLSQELPGETGSWQTIALDEVSWRNHLEHFVKYTCSGI